MPGQVTHPLQVRTHPQAGHNDPQVGRDGLLAREEVEGALFKVSLHLIEVVVGGDDALGQRQVGIEQGD